MWETWVQFLGWEDSLEEDMATHSSILAWRIPWTEEPGGLQSMGSQRVRHDGATNTVRSRAACDRKRGVQGSVTGEESEMGGGGVGAETAQMLGPLSHGPGLPLACLDEIGRAHV